MPLYTKPETGIAAPLSLNDFQPTWADSFAMGWREGWRFNPSQSLINLARVSDTPEADFDADADLANFAKEEREFSRDDGMQPFHVEQSAWANSIDISSLVDDPENLPPAHPGVAQELEDIRSALMPELLASPYPDVSRDLARISLALTPEI